MIDRPEIMLVFVEFITLHNILKTLFERNHYLPSLNSLCLGMVYWRQTWGKKIFSHHASNQGGIRRTRQMLPNLDCGRRSALCVYCSPVLSPKTWLTIKVKVITVDRRQIRFLSYLSWLSQHSKDGSVFL